VDSGRTLAQQPWVIAFRRDASLPAWVLGPVDLRLFSLLIRRRSDFEMGIVLCPHGCDLNCCGRARGLPGDIIVGSAAGAL
jgi:hypothetical protein